MKRGFIVCLLVFGLTQAAEDNVGSATKDVTAGTNINFRFFEKNKRGAAKITNADSPSFNHLSAGSVAGNSVSSGGFKPSVATSNPPPFRYLYNQQYYQPSPYLTYVQLPQAAQIAAQYSIQSNPVAHFLQTPNQIQYVAAPTIAQVPQIKYQSFSNEFSSANAPTSDSSASTSGSSQYSSQQSQQSSTSSASTVSQTKQVQIPFYQSYQTPQLVYYGQQPLLTYFQQPQTANFIYHQPNANYLKQQQQQQLASLYGANRFGLYTPTQNTQLSYLVPVVLPQPEQDSTTTTSNLKSSDKSTSSPQQSGSSSSYSFESKA